MTRRIRSSRRVGTNLGKHLVIIRPADNNDDRAINSSSSLDFLPALIFSESDGPTPTHRRVLSA